MLVAVNLILRLELALVLLFDGYTKKYNRRVRKTRLHKVRNLYVACLEKKKKQAPQRITINSVESVYVIKKKTRAKPTNVLHFSTT